jgi:hypothetical protein
MQMPRFVFGAPNAGKEWSNMDDSDLLDFEGGLADCRDSGISLSNRN